MEDDLLFRLALCVDPHIPETAGIVQKALRSMKPEFAKDERDRAARAARAKKLRKEMLTGTDIPRDAVYPGLGERWGRPLDQGIAFHIPANSFRRLTEKIVKGIYFLEDKKFLEPPYTIDFYAVSDEGAQPVKELLDRFGRLYAREPGVVVRRMVPEDEPMSSIFEITIWAQFKMYASVLPGNH
jgi:hypothetical protein